MVEIKIELPESLIDQVTRRTSIEISRWVQEVIKEKIERLEKAEHFKEIVARSNATDKDVKELTDKANTTMWEYHKEKYNL